MNKNRAQLRNRLWVLVALLVAGGPAFAFDEVAVRLDPIQPLSGEDFVFVIEGEAETVPLLEAVELDGLTLRIRLQRDICRATLCPPIPFRLEVPIDGSTDPLPNGIYYLEVEGRAGVEPDARLFFFAAFGIGDKVSHSMMPSLVLEPSEATDNDRLRLMVPVVANTCGPSAPELERIERDGNLISVFLHFYPGFGSELITTSGKDAKCTPAVPYLSVSQVDLGFLEAGEYRLDLYLSSNRGGILPLRVETRPFVVTDAPDEVALRDGRFKVQVYWKDHRGRSGVGKPVPDPASDSALFTFLGRDNWELLIKVLDGCALNEHFWVFGSAATDVEYTISVTDTQSGANWTYFNPLGNASDAINDTTAFFTCSP